MNNDIACPGRILLAIFVLALGVGGCPPGAGPGGGDTTGAGTPGAAVSATARTAVIDDLGATFATLDPSDVAGTQAAVVSMLKGRNEIQAAGVNPDGSVWAVFTDGRPLVVALNQPIPEDVLDAGTGAPRPRLPASVSAPRATGKPGRAQDKGGPYGVPTSNQAIVLNGYGLEGDTQAHVNAVAAWLVRRGYTDVAPDHLATIENYQLVQNAGVVYVNGHGGIGYLPVVLGTSVSYEPVFALGTLTDRAADGSTDAQYEDLLKTQQIGYLAIPTFRGVPLAFGPRAASRYFITKQFVLEKWDLAPASWVYLDVCDGFDPIFKDACFEAGAGHFIAWDLTVRHSDSIESSRYLLTRTLGISDAAGAVKVPPQRAFDFAAVYARMELASRSNAPQIPGLPPDILTESFSIHNTENSGRAVLRYETQSSVPGPLLQPGIRSVKVSDPAGEITILGSFGAEPGTITVGGSPVTIAQWGNFTVSGFIRPEAHGPVVVTLGSHDSDARMLTQWKGTASAVYSGLTTPTEKVTIDFTFRGDLQSSRPFPDEAPKFNSTPDFRCVRQFSSLTQADVSGTIPCSNNSPMTATVSTPNPLVNADYIDFGDSGDGFWFQPNTSEGIAINQDTGALRVGLAFGARQANGVLTVSHCSGGNNTLRSPLDIGSGITVDLSVGSYNFSDAIPVTENGYTLTTSIQMTATDTPSDSDPR